MKVFQMSNRENCLYFSNYQRVDEEIIFNKALEYLKNDKSFAVSNELKGPSENIYNCSVKNYNFELILDVDYGTYIRSDNNETIEYLKAYFNK